ncbi:anti-sigma factor [Gracilimonas halophila]|uniref:Uncharacterized protein n=1 Tax=Gracilimonas halophila TaxID=1834464 RepID=A0ABW5JIW8_9BACT
MHTDENKAIRYLMKEMDPSEEIEFEKQMREDGDLLIEVESLRATNNKLSGLPHKTPSADLTATIIENAKETQSRRSSGTANIIFFMKRGIAAAILLGAFTGGYMYYSDYSSSQPPQSTGAETVEPWVDRNEILRFSADQQEEQSSTLDADLDRSYEKLQLVNDPTGTNSSGNGILLTGSSN